MSVQGVGNVAALGLVQLEKIQDNLKFRRHVQERYGTELNGYIEPPAYSATVQYYCARVPEEHRDKLIDYLACKKIHTSVHFKPLHLHDIIRQDRSYLVADDVWPELISLPVHNRMVEEDIDYVIYWVKKYFEDLK